MMCAFDYSIMRTGISAICTIYIYWASYAGYVARTPYILSHIIECIQHVKCNTMDSDHCCRRSLQPIRTVFLPLFVPCSNSVCVFFFFKAIKCITVCKHIFIFHAERAHSKQITLNCFSIFELKKCIQENQEAI